MHYRGATTQIMCARQGAYHERPGGALDITRGLRFALAHGLERIRHEHTHDHGPETHALLARRYSTILTIQRFLQNAMP